MSLCKYLGDFPASPKRAASSAMGQKLTLGGQRGKVSFGPEADKVTTIYLPHPRPFLASLITKRIPSTSSDGAGASIILSTSRRAGSQSSPPDQRTKHDGGSHRGVTAEHHEAHAPALCGHEDAERQQQHPCTGSPKSIGRHPRQRLAENIALLAVRGEGQRSKARQTQPKGKQMDHSAAQQWRPAPAACASIAQWIGSGRCEQPEQHGAVRVPSTSRRCRRTPSRLASGCATAAAASSAR